MQMEGGAYLHIQVTAGSRLCLPRLGAEDPQAINPLYLRKIATPLSKAPIYFFPLTPRTGSWPCSQEGGRRPTEWGGVCVGRGTSCPVLKS